MHIKKSSVLAGLGSLLVTAAAPAHEDHQCPAGFADDPAVAQHIEQAQVLDPNTTFDQVFDWGKHLFEVKFNLCDGQGRPATTGAGDKRIADQPARIRTSAPDADSCSGCHAQPFSGGSGDFVANVFVLAQAADPVIESVSSDFSNERNTLGMFGAGPIEMLAREMTLELQSQAAALSDGDGQVISSKGVDFYVDISGGQVVRSWGVDTDLMIKPFHQAGVVRSIREFTVNAYNHHHGMQAEERFDLTAKGADFDEDGVQRELTIGDITAATLWQAALGTPMQVMPKDPEEQQRVKLGEQAFDQVDCTSCHVPEMVLESRMFVEPNPMNPAGTFSDSSQSYSFDMTRQGQYPRLEPLPGDRAMVRAYTDLKRHNLCDPVDLEGAVRHYCNEKLTQGRPEQDGLPGTEFFLTRKLWDAGNSAPYGHRGDLTTLFEAIMAHGGEARESRDDYLALPEETQKDVIRFLKTLQVVDPMQTHEPRRLGEFRSN